MGREDLSKVNSQTSRVSDASGSLATGVGRFLRNKAKLSAITLRNSGDVNIHCHRRRDAARGGASGLQALEFVQGLVEAPLYGGLVARELGEGIGAVGVPGEGPAERSVLRVLLNSHTQSQMNTLRNAKRGQRTCALHRGQHKISGPGTESISTYGGRRLGQGGHRSLHKDGNQIELLAAPDQALTSSFCPFSGPTKGGRKRSNARRGGCAIPTWPRGLWA